MNNQITLLYVDDEPTNLLLFKINFKKKYDVITGLSGVEGLELLRQNSQISVVVSDMKMPGMNGLEFIQIAKKEFPEIKFYILTGFAITAEISQAIEEKLILQYFAKPFNIPEIDKAIIAAFNE